MNYKVAIGLDGDGFGESLTVSLSDLGFGSIDEWNLATDSDKSGRVAEFFAESGHAIWDFDAFGVSYKLLPADEPMMNILLFDYETGRMTNVKTVNSSSFSVSDYLDDKDIHCDDQTVVVFGRSF